MVSVVIRVCECVLEGENILVQKASGGVPKGDCHESQEKAEGPGGTNLRGSRVERLATLCGVGEINALKCLWGPTRIKLFKRI